MISLHAKHLTLGYILLLLDPDTPIGLSLVIGVTQYALRTCTCTHVHAILCFGEHV